jgi:hypothetical protein
VKHASQTERYNVSIGGNQQHGGSEEAAAGADTVMSWTWTTSDTYMAIGVALQASADTRRAVSPMVFN